MRMRITVIVVATLLAYRLAMVLHDCGAYEL